ncbi:hypothetical protein [Lacrimispora sp.]|uniref:hypothetical protein n=1 Tax=Lacrimispora sp. TaxID=2719234 RepID=UPI0028B03EF0|nr:hypothetical protein [Lacrimispora sp.]
MQKENNCIDSYNARKFYHYDIGYALNINETAKTANMLLAVCGAKHYEIPRSMILLKRLETMDTTVFCLLTYKKVKGDYAAILQGDFYKVLLLEYHPEPTDGMSNAKAYKAMMTKYIAGA